MPTELAPIAKSPDRLYQYRVRQRFTRLCTVVMLVALVVAGDLSRGDDWPQFLGPDRDGKSAETDLIENWPQEGLPQLWRVPGGVGMSGLAIQGDRVVTMVQKSGQQFVLCLSLKTGETLWETPVASAYENSMGDGPRATPTIHNDEVFVFTGEGKLVALKLSEGAIRWSVDVVRDLQGRVADYGMASSPLIVEMGTEKLVVVTPGADRGTVAAYSLDGKLAWAVGADRAGYSSPRLVQIAGRSVILVFSGESLLGISPAGKLLWRYPYATDYECNIAAPLLTEQGVFISSGENHGSELIAVEPKGMDYELTPVWSSFGARSAMRNEWQTSILLDGFLYGFDNVGSAGPVTHFNCVEAATGQRRWQKTRFGKGNLIAADGKLFLSTMDGELVVLAASPEGFRELGRQQVLGSTRQAPALSDGRLLLRDNSEIVCLDARRP